MSLKFYIVFCHYTHQLNGNSGFMSDSYVSIALYQSIHHLLLHCLNFNIFGVLQPSSYSHNGYQRYELKK